MSKVTIVKNEDKVIDVKIMEEPGFFEERLKI